MGTGAAPQPGSAAQDPAAGQPGGSGGQAGTGRGPDQPGTAGGGGQQEGGGAGGDGPQGTEEFNREQLDPVLRGMSPNEINELFGSLTTALRARPTPEPEPEPDPVDDEFRRTFGIGGSPAAAQRPQPAAAPDGGQQPAAPAPAQPQPLSPEQLKDMFNPESEQFNPEQAITRIVATNYGGLIGDINQRSLEGVFSSYRQRVHDFAEYEPAVREALAEIPAHLINDRLVGQFYLVKKGERVTQQEMRDRAKASAGTTLKPTPPEPPKPDVKLDPLEEDVARKMFRRHKDPVAEYKKWREKVEAGPVRLKVPTGGGQFHE